MVCPGRPEPNYIDAQTAAGYWLRAGGSEDNLIAAVAVAVAESSLDTANQSPDCALGLWQILFTNAAGFGFQPADLYNPAINAYVAVQMSGNGSEWGPWDVAYAEGENLRQRRSIPYPEQGSAAYAYIPQVAAALGMTGGGGAGMPVNVQNPPGGGGAPSGGGGPGGVSGGQPYIAPPPQGQGGQGYTGIQSISVPYAYGGGWDNLRQYWSADQDQLYQYFNMISQRIGGSLG